MERCSVHRRLGFVRAATRRRKRFNRRIVIHYVTPPIVVEAVGSAGILREMIQPPLHVVQVMRLAPGVAIHNLLCAGKVGKVEPIVSR